MNRKFEAVEGQNFRSSSLVLKVHKQTEKLSDELIHELTFKFLKHTVTRDVDSRVLLRAVTDLRLFTWRQVTL